MQSEPRSHDSHAETTTATTVAPATPAPRPETLEEAGVPAGPAFYTKGKEQVAARVLYLVA